MQLGSENTFDGFADADTRHAILENLVQYGPEEYRRRRWVAMDTARQLDPPISWDDIAGAMGIVRGSAIRMYGEMLKQGKA
ncbi:hypothetical protein [Microbacterium sp.]|uniref:hypothetical protein n=1 Tax=Microbacterium sp. TaxID=51671 RepID=UPI0039E3E1BC